MSKTTIIPKELSLKDRWVQEANQFNWNLPKASGWRQKTEVQVTVVINQWNDPGGNNLYEHRECGKCLSCGSGTLSAGYTCLNSFRRPEGGCLITRSMSPQGRPLFLQSSRNISVNIVNSNNQLLTQLVTGKARRDAFRVAFCWFLMWSVVRLKHRSWRLHQEHTWSLLWAGTWTRVFSCHSTNSAGHGFIQEEVLTCSELLTCQVIPTFWTGGRNCKPMIQISAQSNLSAVSVWIKHSVKNTNDLPPSVPRL